MGELAKSLAESYAEDLKAWFRFEMMLAALVAALLFWAGGHETSSAFLGLCNAKLSDLTDEAHGLSSLPIYVFMGSLALGFVLDWVYLLAARRWFEYVVTMRRVQEQLAAMESQQLRVRTTEGGVDVRELVSAERQLTDRREEVKKVVRSSKLSFLLGAILTLASFRGTWVDALIATALIVLSLFLLKNAAGLFLRRVGPKLAEVRAIRDAVRPM